MGTLIAPNCKNRMILLLRNSSKKQAEKVVRDDGRIEYDIPLQRNILRPWAERLGYEIVDELVEGGISGYKISADKRDAVVELKRRADLGEFDVLGIYMSDRLGRIADETPLIVSFLNARGIRVLSYTDGEISSATHNDKLMTYIRFWQAEGESLKTSIRIKDAQAKAVEQGVWRAGPPPYGYRTVSRGTLNGKGKPILDVEMDPAAAEVVKKVFKLYKDHYSFRGIARHLNEHNIPTARGAFWSDTHIKKMLENKLYIGVYVLGRDSENGQIESPVMEKFRILSDDEFNHVQGMIHDNRQKFIQNREDKKLEQRPTIRGSRILTGLLYCECGKKCTSQTHRYARERANGTTWYWENASYRCGSYRTPKKGLCNKLPFRAETLEKLVIADAKRFLVETDIIKLSQSNEMDIQAKIDMLNNGLCQLKQEKAKKEKERQKFKDEFGKVILGESQASQSLLMELIQVKEEELVAVDKRIKKTEGRIDELQLTIETQKSGIYELRNWRERFDSQDAMEKKTMLINLIDKIVLNDEFVEVAYKVPIDNYIEQQYCAVDDAENVNCEQFGFLSSPEFVQTQGYERTTPTRT